MKKHVRPSLLLELSFTFRLWLFCVFLLGASFDQSRADDQVWDGATDAFWSDIGNWGGAGAVPGTGDTATFSGVGGADDTIDLSGGVTITSIVFDTAAAASYTIGMGAVNAQAITFDDGGSILMSADVMADQLFNTAVTLGADGQTATYTIDNDSTTNWITFAGDITGGSGGTAGDKTILVIGDGDTNFNGVISNGGATSLAITKSGEGNLSLTGDNTFSGDLTLDAGGVTIGDITTGTTVTGQMGGGTLRLNGGELGLVSGTSNNITFGGTTVVGGDVMITGSRPDGSTSSGTTFRLGSLSIGSHTLSTARGLNFSGNNSATIRFDGATLTGDAVFAPSTRNTIYLVGGVTESGGSRSITADGSGTGAVLRINGAGGWSGGTTLNGGVLRIDSADGLGANGTALNPTLTTLNGGTLQLFNHNAARNNRRIDVQGAVIIQLRNNVNRTFSIGELNDTGSGRITIAAGRTSSAGTQTPTMTLNNDLALNGDLRLQGLFDDNTLVMGGVISDGTATPSNLVVSDTGIVRLDGQNTYSGTTTVNEGILRLGDDEVLPSGAGKGDFILDTATTATFDLNGFSQTLNGISSSGAGTNIIDNAGGTDSVLTLGANDADGSFGGTIQNSGVGNLGITKMGAGTLALTGVGTYTGETTVNGGILAVQPDVLAATSMINIGTASDGTLSFDRDGTGDLLTLAANTGMNLGGATSAGEIVFQLGAGTGNSDRILLSGTGALTVGAGGGLISGIGLSGFAAGDYNLITGSNAIVGAGNLDLGSLPGGFIYAIDTATDPTILTLSATAAAGGDVFWTGDVDGSWAALSGGNTNWSTAADGSVEAGFTPGASNTVNFSATNGINTVTTVDNVYSIEGLNFLNSGTAAVTINEGVFGSLTIGSGGIDVQTGSPVTATITAPLELGANQAWTVADSGTLLDVGGAVSGSANLSKAGAGILTLSGDNSMSGVLSLDAGTLNINSATALGTGGFTVNGGTLDNTSGGALVLSTTNAQTWGGNFAFTGTHDLDLGTGDVTLTGNREVTVNNGVLSVDKITGGFGLTKNGTGTLEVGVGGDYTGATIINGGVFQASATNAFSMASAYTVESGATLRLNNTNQFETEVGGLGSLAGSGILENAGSSNRTISVGYDDTSTEFSGILQDGGVGKLGLRKWGEGTLTLSGSSSTLTGNLDVQEGVVAITGSFNNGVGDTDAGTLDNSSGMIQVSTGGSLSTDLITLGNSNSSRAGTLVIDGGDVSTTNAITTAGIDAGSGGYGGVFLSSGSLSFNRLDSGNRPADGTTVIQVSGGTLNAAEYIILRNQHSEFTVSGGQVIRNASSQNLALAYQNSGTTVFNVAGGVIDNSGRQVTFGQSNAATGNGVLNINSGKLTTDMIRRNRGTATVNFNGGTLAAGTSEAEFFAAAADTVAYVNGAFGSFAGGAVIDSNGNDITMSVALETPTGNGLGGLTLSNAGSGYIGAPYVEITGGGGSGATGYAVVDLDPASGTFGQLTGVVLTNPGIGYTGAPTINLIGGGGTGAAVSPDALVANTSGGLSKIGSGTLTLEGASTYTGGTAIGGGVIALGANDALPAGGAVTIDTGGSLDLSTFNNTVGQVTLIDGSILGTSGVLTSTSDFDLRSGSVSGILSGAVGIDKSTAGTVTLSAANTFSEAVSITAGTLAFDAANQLGDASVTNTLSIDGGTLSYTGITTETLAANQVLAIGTGGATINAGSAAGTLELAGGITTAATGNLTKTGVGTVTVSGTTDLNGGDVSVEGGTLNAGFSASGIDRIDVSAGGALNLFDNTTISTAVTGLNLADGSALGFDLDAVGVNDSITLTGTASDAGTISLNFNDLGGLAVGTYDLITSTGGGLDATYILGFAPAGLNYSFTTPGSNIVRLTTSKLNLRYWQGDQSGSWSTNNLGNTNWAIDAAGIADLASLPGASDSVVFSTTNASGSSISTTLDGDFTVDSLQFTSNPAGVTDVTVAQGSSGTLTLAPQSSNNGVLVEDNAGDITISAPLVVGAAQTWSVVGTGANGSSLSIDGMIDFTNGVTKTGDGVLTLEGANTGAGGLAINGGTFNIGNATAPGSGTLGIGAGITIDNSSGGALALTNNNALSLDGSFTFTGTDDLDLGTGSAGLGNNAVITTSAGHLTIGGSIDDGGNNFSLSKAGAGTLVLNGANTIGGGVNLTEGALNIGNAAALGSGTFAIGTGTTFDNTSGGSITLASNNSQTWDGDFTFTGSDNFNLGAGNVTLSSPVSVNVAANTLTVGGVIDDGVSDHGLTKTGAGTLTLDAVNTYGGQTSVDDGTLIAGVSGAIPTGTIVKLGSGSTAGILDLNGFDVTIGGLLSGSTTDAVENEIIIGSGTTLTVNGAVTIGPDVLDSSTFLKATGGGDLVVNTGGSTFQVGGATTTSARNAATLDLSELANVTIDVGAGIFNVGDFNSANLTNFATSKVILGTNNTISAGSFRVGTNVDPQNLGDPHSVTLGSGTNIINSGNVVIGSGLGTNQARSSGLLSFAADDTTGTLQLRAADGIARIRMYMINSTSGTGNSMASEVDFRDHDVDVLVSTLDMALRTQGNGNATSTLHFNEGVFDLTTLKMAHKVDTGNGDVTATINIGDSGSGSVFTVNNTTTMAVSTSDTAGSEANATINVSGGTVSFGAIDMADAAAGRTANSEINITGGTVTMNGNITRSGGDGTENASVTLNGGTLDMNGRSIGTNANNVTFNAQSGTLSNLNQVNGSSAALTKTTAGTLVLEGDNTYSGGTVINGGTLQIGSGSPTGTIGSGDIVNESVLAVNRSDTYTLSEVVSGAGELRQTGAGITKLTGDSDYTGTTTVSSGTLQIGDGGTTGSIDDTSAITIAGGANVITNRDGTLNLAQGISGGGNLIINNPATGETVLAGANDYTGTTAVNGGTLLVNGNQSSATGNVSVATGGTLGGIGTLGGATTIDSGGRLTGGTNGGAGTLSFVGNLTTASGSSWLVDLVQGATDVSDSISVGGNLDITGSAFVDNFSGSFTGGTSYQIASYTGNLTGTFASWGNNTERTLGGGQYLINYGSGSNSVITLTAVPEPAAFLPLLLLAFGGGWILRRRRREVAE
ncbi:MAG: autotransporter-associated beta strand repeat-containing protein [Verrucomicrobiales bacterium]|nr:autotransporter-associated beta strand repeat-containing protein [Verrucomicrobiales bacterium]